MPREKFVFLPKAELSLNIPVPTGFVKTYLYILPVCNSTQTAS